MFQYALLNTSEFDLARALYLRARSAERWLDQRQTYTRSLAVMSMIGYVLGLGDRHPCNLMVERHSGAVVHIDFGDCRLHITILAKFSPCPSACFRSHLLLPLVVSF